MASPEAVRRAMSSGSVSRRVEGVIARGLLLATLDLVGEERSIRDLDGFVAQVGGTDHYAPRQELYGLIRSGALAEIRDTYMPNDLYVSQRYALNRGREVVIAATSAEKIKLMRMDIGRDALSELVELQISGDIAHRQVELRVRELSSP